MSMVILFMIILLIVVLILWLALLLVTSSLLLVHSFLTALLPSLRRRALTQLAGGGLASHIVDTLVDKLSYGDWLVVIRIASHFTPDVVRSVLAEVERGIVEKEEEGDG